MPDPQPPSPPEPSPPLTEAGDFLPAVPPAPRDRADSGCLLLLGVVFVGVFLLPAVIMLGGAPLLIPGLLAVLAAVLTPLLNPAEKMSRRARWTGRVIVFLVLCSLVAGTLFFLWSNTGGLLRE